MDGMKHSNDHIFLNAFAHEDRKLEKERAIYYIMYDETSLGERRKRHGGVQTDLVEHMHVVTPSTLKLPVAQRKLSATSTNQSNHIGPLVTDSRPEHVWSVSFYEKKKILCDARVPVGGATPGAPDAQDQKRRLDVDVEPVSYHGNSRDFYEELIS